MGGGRKGLTVYRDRELGRKKKKKKSMNACWVYFRSTRKEAKSSVVVGVFKQIRGFLLNHGQIL